MKRFIFRPLREAEIKFMVASVSDRVLELSPYIERATVTDILDDAVGNGGWQVEFGEYTNGSIKCTLSLYDDTTNQWVSKTYNGAGADPQTAATYAFKRAAKMWGIGKALDMHLNDFDSIEVEDYQQYGIKPRLWKSKVYVDDTFVVTQLGYSESGELTCLVIKDTKLDKVVYHEDYRSQAQFQPDPRRAGLPAPEPVPASVPETTAEAPAKEKKEKKERAKKSPDPSPAPSVTEASVTVSKKQEEEMPAPEEKKASGQPESVSTVPVTSPAPAPATEKRGEVMDAVITTPSSSPKESVVEYNDERDLVVDCPPSFARAGKKVREVPSNNVIFVYEKTQDEGVKKGCLLRAVEEEAVERIFIGHKLNPRQLLAEMK